MSTIDDYRAWAADPAKTGTLPYGIFEPSERRDGVGAALVIRAAVYFKGGFNNAKRTKLVAFFEHYRQAIGNDTLTWFFAEGKPPVTIAKATSLAKCVQDTPASTALSFFYTGGKLKYEASVYQFGLMCLPDWEAEMGTRGLDVLSFSVPPLFIRERAGVFEALFRSLVDELDAVHAHAGYAVNLSPLDHGQNFASEFFIAHEAGPGVDIGEPSHSSTIRLYDKIKTVDWLLAINSDIYKKLPKDHPSLGLPPDWFGFASYGSGGVIIQSGVYPQTTGETPSPDSAATPPPAYVLLYHALQSVVADTTSSLQPGRSIKPTLNNKIASNAWLKRFSVDDKDLASYWLELHRTAKLDLR